MSGGTGTEEKGFGSIRYGGKLGEKFSYKVYGKYRNRDAGKNVDGSDSFDDIQMGQGGFRSDWEMTESDHLTTQGDYYYLDAEMDFKSTYISLVDGTTPFRGGNIQQGGNFLSRWTRELKDDSSLMVQIYYDRLERQSLLPFFHKSTDQLDFEFQHNISIGTKQKFSWGLNYRFVNFNFQETSVLPNAQNVDTHQFSFFLHDEITIIPKRWKVILGSKFEHNEFSGFEFQPNLRTVWTPDSRNTFWGAISRAVRTPDIGEEKLSLERTLIPLAGADLLIREANDGRTEAEELLAFELGYRHQISDKNLNIEFTTYMFDYKNIIAVVSPGSVQFQSTPTPAHLLLTLLNENALEGEIYGFELNAEWRPNKNWLLSAGYSFNQADLRKIVDIPVSSIGDFAIEGEPENIFNFRSYLELPHDLELDTMLYYVSKNFSSDVKAYTRLDLRLGWRPTPDLELSFVGQNLLDDQHEELNELLEFESETQRSFYSKATLRF